LISDNNKQVHSYFAAIMRYRKDKKVNDELIKAFLFFLRRNMAVVKVEENYNTQKWGC